MGFKIEGNYLIKYEEEDGILEVKIPENVETIAFDAFSDCKKIRKIEFPGTVKEIKDIWLAMCDSLEEIVLNEGTEMIDWQVFWTISNYAPIKSIKLPQSCGCYCRWTPPLERFLLEDGVVYTVDKKRIIYGLPGVGGVYKLPDSVEEIDQYALSHTNRKEIIIPKGFILPKDAFFDYRDFSIYVKNKEVLKIDFQLQEKLPAHYSEYMKISQISGMDVAYVIIFQSGKGWDTAINEKISTDNALVNATIPCFKTLLPGNKEAVFKKTVSFILNNIQYISGEVLEDFIDFLNNNKSKSVELLTKDMIVQNILQQCKKKQLR